SPAITASSTVRWARSTSRSSRRCWSSRRASCSRLQRVGGRPTARTVRGRIPLGLVLSFLVLGCAHPTLPECPEPKSVDSPWPGPDGEVWDPNAALRAHDRKGKQFGTRDRYTILDVTLDGAGAISGMSVSRSSGLDFLDDAAMEAFHRAAPFG